MINKKGGAAIEILVMLVVVVIASFVILFLVQAGTINVKADVEDVPLLNTEFIPYGRGGSLVVKEFQFCGIVDTQYQCFDEKDVFKLGDEVHFRFIVESSTFNGDVMLVENYRLKGPHGKVLLDVDEKNNFNYDLKSDERIEDVYFKDYFIVGVDMPVGEYTLELLMKNPLLNKETTLVKTFEMRLG